METNQRQYHTGGRYYDAGSVDCSKPEKTTGKNETEFPDKEKKFKKIDGAVALLMGISRAMVLAGEPTGDEFYDDPIMVGV